MEATENMKVAMLHVKRLFRKDWEPGRGLF